MKNILHKFLNFFTSHQEDWNRLNEEIKKYENFLGLRGRTGKELFYDPHFKNNPEVWRKYNFECRKRYLKDLIKKYESKYRSPDIIGGTAVKIVKNYEGCERYEIQKPPSCCYREDIIHVKIHIVLVKKTKYKIPQKYISNIESFDCIITWRECDNIEDYYIIEKIAPNNQLIKDIIYDNKEKIS